MSTVRLAVPRKGRPLEAVLDRIATVADCAAVADDVTSTLRYEKAVAKGNAEADSPVYERLASISDRSSPQAPEYTLLRDDREGMPRRIVFDSLTVTIDGTDVQLVGREEPFRALRTHEFALGFDSADLVLEEVVQLDAEPLRDVAGINDRIDPLDTDVRVVAGLGDTVRHTLLATPAVVDRVAGRNGSTDISADSPDANEADSPDGNEADSPDRDEAGSPRENGDGAGADEAGQPTRALVDDYEGPFCISPRYERLIEAVLGTDALAGISFTYPPNGQPEEAAIAETGIGAYLTVTGSTAREHGLLVGESLFPSETVLLENDVEVDEDAARVRDELAAVETSAIPAE